MIKAIKMPVVDPFSDGSVPTYCITASPVRHRQKSEPVQLNSVPVYGQRNKAEVRRYEDHVSPPMYKQLHAK